MNDTDRLQARIDELERQVQAIADEYYRDNFPGSQDFSKYVRFNSRLKVPSYSTLPSTCEVGEIVESGGKLRICSAANTWTIVGTQS